MKNFEEHECVIEGFYVIDEGGDEFIHPKKNMKNKLAGDCWIQHQGTEGGGPVCVWKIENRFLKTWNMMEMKC